MSLRLRALLESPLLDPLYGWRDRLLADPRFQRWAAGFPLTRPIARRQAGALFDLVAGFVYSQVLTACLKLKLFDVLAEGPRTVAELAPRLGLAEPAAARLLAAAAALGLAQRRGAGRYGLGLRGAALRGNRGIAEMVEHHAMLYADLADPVALLRGERPTRLSGYWPYAASDDPGRVAGADVAAYSDLMSASQALVADDILDAYPLVRHRRLLDVGGGDGTFLTAVAARAPHLELVLFDLPAVAERARVRLAAAGLSARAQVVGGSFRSDALPPGADLVTLVRIVHDHDDAVVRALLAAVRRALPPGGVLLIAEPMAGTPGAEAMGDAYFGFYLMAMGSGRPRSAEELAKLLGEAGFAGVRRVRTRRPLLTSLLIAQAPAVDRA